MRYFAILILFASVSVFAQPCTTTNAGGCGCPDGRDTCYLLPDLTISWQALSTDGPTEYSQTGNGANDGRLRITGCTPNTGYGPFTVKGTDYYICGTDTIIDTGGSPTCPSGAAPTNMLTQRIYKKMGATMGFEDHLTGGQTYHPTHGHNHVDDWVTFTLRIEDPNEPDTLKWPIIGNGAKLGFCLMDYGSCNSYNGYCRDNQKYGGGVIKTSANTPNYGLGGGQYSCSPVEQGISVGYADIYDQSLDGMWINIPPNTCNGNYWIVGQVDPRNTFMESNENNNWTAVPVTLTKQLSSPVADISINGNSLICSGDSVMLDANPAQSYLWSTGETTQSISVKNPGDYFVETVAQCGTDVSDTVIIDEINSAITNFAEDTACVSGAVSLFAAGTGTVSWFDLMTGGTPISTGDSFTTPVLTASATFYAENYTAAPGAISFSAPHDHNGSSLFSTFHGHIIFDCLSAFTLKSVKVYTDDAGIRVIEWRSSNGNILADTSVFIPSGTSRVTLNFNITPGTDYQLGTNESANNANLGQITPLLRRSSSGVTYPYEVPGILSLKGSPYDSQFAKYYYYFYDWEVETGGGSCVSPRQPVTAFISQGPVVMFTGLDSVYQISDASATLNGSPSGGSFSGSGITGNTFDPLLAGIGFHTVVYSYEDASGCNNEYSVTVHVKKGQIIASAGADVAICEGESATLTASGGTIFEWSTGDTTESIQVNPAVTTIYNVIVSDNFGSSDVADVKVTVNALPIVEITGIDTLYQASDNVVTIAGSPVGGIFSGDGVNGNSFDPALAGVGFHDISYSYTDGASCQNESSVTVHVKQGTITASAGSDTEICEGNSTTLTASGGTIFEWSTGETIPSIQVNPIVTTTYYVTVSDNGGSSDVAQVTVSINPLPQVNFTGLDAEFEVDAAPKELIGSPSGGTFSGSGIQGNTFYPMSAGVGGPYAIVYSYTDQKGCQNSVSQQVTVKTNVGVPMTNNLHSQISVYPNPASELMNIDCSGIRNMNIELRLFNSLGGKVLSGNFVVSENHHLTTIDLSSLAKGIYFLEVVTSETSSITRIVKK